VLRLNNNLEGEIKLSKLIERNVIHPKALSQFNDALLRAIDSRTIEGKHQGYLLNNRTSPSELKKVKQFQNILLFLLR
jgi:hypothetical protein